MTKLILIVVAAILSARAYADISSQLVEVWDCVTNVDAAIVARGGTLVGGGKLRNASAGIATIPTGSDITTESLTATNNGDYAAPAGHAYTNVTVAVPGSSAEPYIQCNGGAIAMTDIQSANGLRIRFRIMCDVLRCSMYNQAIFGVRRSSEVDSIAWQSFGHDSTTAGDIFFTLCYGAKLTPTGYDFYYPTGPTTYDFTATRVLVGDGTTAERTQISVPLTGARTISSSTLRLCIGGVNSAGSMTRAFSGRIYFFEVYDADNHLLGDFRPALRDDHAGFLDRVSGNFYPSVTGEPFEIGGDYAD